MGYPLTLAVRYLSSKKRAFVSVGTAFAILGVTLGVAALAIVMSVTGGFQAQFKEKVLGVNAHVIILKYALDFREYRGVMEKARKVKGVVGVAPFVINVTMLTHGARTATGVTLKGVDPDVIGQVMDLPKYIVAGSIEGLRRPGAKPPERPRGVFRERVEDVDGDGGAAEPSDETGDEINPLPRGRLPIERAVTPTGGFKSHLPDDDALPPALDPDPCKNPASLAALPGVIIGKTLSSQLRAGIDDCIQITSPSIGIAFDASGKGRPAIAKQFRVVGISEAGFDQYDAKFVFADLYEVEQFYEQGDSVTGVEMTVSDIDEAHVVAKDLDRVLANGVYRVMDWHELNRGLFTALLIQQIGMSCVLALIIVVAAFTVVATLIMVVLEKRKEIALLKALGAKSHAILRVFLYQGGFIGAIGTTFGLILGYAGCRALGAYEFPLDAKVYFISTLPVEIKPHEFIITGVFAILISLVATIFPALYAARLRPSDGLRAD